ncbi:MAG: GrpB family protein [Clostridiaceae bacterium]|nr:GrpB family protein [Clostridiaceae bacterium]
MRKSLSEMTLEELWELFPIQLTEHKEYWKDLYLEEQTVLLSFLPKAVRIYHIGSTAIQGIWAKPIIDILVEAPLEDHQTIKELLLKNGYLCMAHNETCMDFNKGYTPSGFAERVFHLHLRKFGDNDELYFRDCLNERPEIAKAYEQLKLSLWKPFEHDRDGYTERKTEFVRKYTQKAIEQYGKGKYNE